MKLPLISSFVRAPFCASVWLLASSAGAFHASGQSAETLTLRVAPERDYVYRRGMREVMIEVDVQAKRAEGSRHTPVNVSVVLDRSGSMEGAKMEKARQAACVALNQLEEDDIFSLVIFDNEIDLLLPPERAGSREHRAEMKRRINRIEPRGGTALYAGVEMGAKQVRRLLDKERVNRVILLSDGQANVGPSSTTELARMGRDLRKEGMSVATIGLGDDFNEDLMTGLAEASRANYYYVKDAEKLPQIFTEELGSAGTRVANNVRIRVEVPAGVRLREIVGHPEITCQERSAEITLPEVFGAEHALYHLRCNVEEDAAKDALSLANVALSYDDAASKKHLSQDGGVTVKFTDDTRESEKSVRDGVAQNVNALQNRLDKEKAIQLADEGKSKEAASLLRRRADVNRAAPASQQMTGVATENSKLDSLADELTSNGKLNKASRKATQYDNYQSKNQKSRW